MSDDAIALALERQMLTASTFVEMVKTLVDDFDVIEVLTVLTTRCMELLAADAAGILLADDDGHLRVVGASSDRVQLLELFQIQNDEGPCFDSYHTGKIVLHSHLDSESPWPSFAAECTKAGFASVCAIPLHLKTQVLGCLNIFMIDPDGLSESNVALAQALADVASITIVQDQATRDSAVREGHLQRALTSRIAIEQAKGMIAERSNINMDEAFVRLRTYARQNNLKLTSLAESLVAGVTAIDALLSPPHS